MTTLLVAKLLLIKAIRVVQNEAQWPNFFIAFFIAFCSFCIQNMITNWMKFAKFLILLLFEWNHLLTPI